MYIKIAKHKSPKKKTKRITSSDDDDVPFWGQVLGTGLKIAGGLIGSQSQSKVQPMGPNDLKKYFSPVQKTINQMGNTVTGMQGTIGTAQTQQAEMANIGRAMMDPGSQMNQNQKQLLQQQSMDQAAMQNLLSLRSTNAGGGASSGVTAAQARRAQSASGKDALAQFSQSMLQQQQAGVGVLGQSGQMLGQISGMQGQMGSLQSAMGQQQMNISENLAQSALAQRQSQMQAAQSNQGAFGSMMGGIGSSILENLL
jgi:hypothetical protein